MVDVEIQLVLTFVNARAVIFIHLTEVNIVCIWRKLKTIGYFRFFNLLNLEVHSVIWREKSRVNQLPVQLFARTGSWVMRHFSRQTTTRRSAVGLYFESSYLHSFNLIKKTTHFNKNSSYIIFFCRFLYWSEWVSRRCLWSTRSLCQYRRRYLYKLFFFQK